MADTSVPSVRSELSVVSAATLPELRLQQAQTLHWSDTQVLKHYGDTVGRGYDNVAVASAPPSYSDTMGEVRQPIFDHHDLVKKVAMGFQAPARENLAVKELFAAATKHAANALAPSIKTVYARQWGK